MSQSMTTVDFTTYTESVTEALNAVGAAEILSRQERILIKPNLINASPHPVTTPAACCEAIIRYIWECSGAEIVIGEGCGDPSLSTDTVFSSLGYQELAERYGLELVDLNTAPLNRMTNSDCTLFTEMYLPEIAFSHFLISVPVLKAHSLADITGTLKNMIGLAPPAHYGGQSGTWKKAAFHRRMQASISDLNRYRTPDLTLMDASIGLADYHLGGPHCDPPVEKLIAGFNPYAVDREAARLLGIDWRSVGHLRNGG
jgi:uncharacterized protein (DUF362 family)